MSAHIAGMGWVTPLGAGLGEVYDLVRKGQSVAISEAVNPVTGARHPYFPVPKGLSDAVSRQARLRRSSAISCHAATAGLAALANAGIQMQPEVAARTAVVFSIVSGGVGYTRRFYETIVSQGARAASPLLFPETVYNAPGSHLCALLGTDRASYTLVGDASVGIAALKLAEQLLATGEADQCVVVGAEEVDWVLCEAYRRAGLSKRDGQSPRGLVLAEGAAAVVLKREGRFELAHIDHGVPFFNRQEAGAAIDEVLGRVAGHGTDQRDGNQGSSGRYEARLVVGSANGTFVDALEARAIERLGLSAVYPKKALGEALGASALMQVIYGALALESQPELESLAVSCLGLNQQASGARLVRA